MPHKKLMPSTSANGEPNELPSTTHYITAIAIFHDKESIPAPIAKLAFSPMRPSIEFQGFLCRTARDMLGVSQAWLWEKAHISRKTINDFENDIANTKRSTSDRLRSVLELHGANFVEGDNFVGVIVYSMR